MVLRTWTINFDGGWEGPNFTDDLPESHDDWPVEGMKVLEANPVLDLLSEWLHVPSESVAEETRQLLKQCGRKTNA